MVPTPPELTLKRRRDMEFSSIAKQVMREVKRETMTASIGSGSLLRPLSVRVVARDDDGEPSSPSSHHHLAREGDRGFYVLREHDGALSLECFACCTLVRDQFSCLLLRSGKLDEDWFRRTLEGIGIDEKVQQMILREREHSVGLLRRAFTGVLCLELSIHHKGSLVSKASSSSSSSSSLSSPPSSAAAAAATAISSTASSGTTVASGREEEEEGDKGEEEDTFAKINIPLHMSTNAADGTLLSLVTPVPLKVVQCEGLSSPLYHFFGHSLLACTDAIISPTESAGGTRSRGRGGHGSKNSASQNSTSEYGGDGRTDIIMPSVSASSLYGGGGGESDSLSDEFEDDDDGDDDDEEENEEEENERGYHHRHGQREEHGIKKRRRLY